MEKHRERVEQVERSSPMQTELAELEEKIGIVKEKSKALLANLSLPSSLLTVPSFPFFLSLLPPNTLSLYVGSSYMHGEGLAILNGEKQREILKQIAEVELNNTLVRQEVSQMEQQVGQLIMHCTILDYDNW